jgi:hypothetical protein
MNDLQIRDLMQMKSTNVLNVTISGFMIVVLNTKFTLLGFWFINFLLMSAWLSGLGGAPSWFNAHESHGPRFKSRGGYGQPNRPSFRGR